MSSTPPIQPALSSEEWKVWHEIDAFERVNFIAIRERLTRHSLAALCLYQQPFGFTHGDVTRNLAIAAHWQRTLDAQGPDATWDFDEDVMAHRRDLIAWHRSLASRISALLPQP